MRFWPFVFYRMSPVDFVDFHRSPCCLPGSAPCHHPHKHHAEGFPQEQLMSSFLFAITFLGISSQFNKSLPSCIIFWTLETIYKLSEFLYAMNFCETKSQKCVRWLSLCPTYNDLWTFTHIWLKQKDHQSLWIFNILKYNMLPNTSHYNIKYIYFMCISHLLTSTHNFIVVYNYLIYWKNMIG